MIEEEGKCRAEAEARGLPENKTAIWNEKQKEDEEEKSKKKTPNQVQVLSLETKHKHKIRHSQHISQ